jgi:ABC-type nitrate/sulfonate/bicarbonate transport system substrate-binding protein
MAERQIRIAPDWLPNTNHAGFYVALDKGWYREEGLAVEILPFDGEAMPNRKLPASEAEFGLMPHQSIISMRRAGHDAVSVAALIQPNTTTLMVLEDSDITHPAEMAGRRYASYGTEYEVAMIQDAIRRDGGTGGPVLVPAEKLDILQALFSGDIDIAWGFHAWEGVLADLAGYRIRHFFITEMGIPNEYFPLLFTLRAYIEREPEVVAAFVNATRRGYEEAARDPDAAAGALLRHAPEDLLPQPAEELVRRSMEVLAPYLAKRAVSDGVQRPWGWHDAHAWATFASYIQTLGGENAVLEGSEQTGFTNRFVEQ